MRLNEVSKKHFSLFFRPLLKSFQKKTIKLKRFKVSFVILFFLYYSIVNLIQRIFEII